MANTDKQLIDTFLDYVFDNPTPVVYFVRCNKFIKIGKSLGNILHLRISEMQTGNPYPIKLESFVLGGHKTENKIHKQMSKYKHRGEWFVLNKKQVKDIVKGHLKNG